MFLLLYVRYACCVSTYWFIFRNNLRGTCSVGENTHCQYYGSLVVTVPTNYTLSFTFCEDKQSNLRPILGSSLVPTTYTVLDHPLHH